MLLEGLLYYVIFIIGFASLGMLTLWVGFRWHRIISMFCFSLILLTSFPAIVDLMGRPRPVDLMLPWQRPDVAEAKMLAKSMKEGVYIMLLLDWDGLDYPRWLRYPWSDKMAEDIRSAEEDAKQKGSTGIGIMNPFEKSLDRREEKFAYPLPVPDMLREKPDQRIPEVKRFDHPSQGI